MYILPHSDVGIDICQSPNLDCNFTFCSPFDGIVMKDDTWGDRASPKVMGHCEKN